ncbi:hypothetical protein K469DRAFT_707080 [Zopfia rhizophila CBS 207.26]|uniref:Single-strand DNA deaminase toxin A-like C-terminal domain-containing protein n=1 Tax=Zopfia rhizophila CBS 207.26 TaxID=1314779 RepID=A0A6A6D5E0_9PEZI|nr:hypothetical protein K469DRAFT_707080 [Zopfia rhizophila CBS 207.26]
MAPNTATQLREARILWWNASQLHVQCPFCGKVHRHGFNGHYGTQTRVPHCASMSEHSDWRYEISFPFDETTGDAWYSIDKQRCLFVTWEGTKVLVQQEKEAKEQLLLEEKLEKLTLAFAQKAEKIKFADAKEELEPETIHGIEVKGLKVVDIAVSRCITGDVAYIRGFLNSSSEKDIFLRGKDEDGTTALILAATETSVEMVKLLLEEGADPNVGRLDGRTPLMMAALWGRLDSVHLLLRHGANKDAIDGAGFRAIDLAQPSQRNDEERERTHGLYKETKIDDKRRAEIVRVLQPRAKERRVPVSIDAHTFKKSPLDGAIYHQAPIAKITVERQSKTVACLTRGPGLPDIYSKSGWGHAESNTIDGAFWTGQVMKLAQKIGHDLPVHEWDYGISGQFNASHAEKQLMAYFVGRHTFFKEEIGSWDEEQERINMAMRQAGDYYNTPLPIRKGSRSAMHRGRAERDISVAEPLSISAPYKP